MALKFEVYPLLSTYIIIIYGSLLLLPHAWQLVSVREREMRNQFEGEIEEFMVLYWLFMAHSVACFIVHKTYLWASVCDDVVAGEVIN